MEFKVHIHIMIEIYTAREEGQAWLSRYQGHTPQVACILGFTATGLIEGISAAGSTPDHRRYTALADAEFLLNGVSANPTYPLPPLTAGISPVLITRAVIESLSIPVTLFNAGLPQTPSVPYIDLGGTPANCLTSGSALPLETVKHLYQAGLFWGKKLVEQADDGSYLILGECVVGGTTTALALLLGLGFDAQGKVNSSHSNCNHQQKLEVVWSGLNKAQLLLKNSPVDPFKLVAAIGDPMQIVVAAMAIAASSQVGVLLAGGTQMLAVYALIKSLIVSTKSEVNLKNILVGTTRWVAEDPTGDTVGLAEMIGDVCLIATKLSFAQSIYPNLRIYEEGFVKEGVAAGGLAITAHLLASWTQSQLQSCIESMVERYSIEKTF
jgi:uncharacterized protein (TIGR00303 family)